MNNISQHISYKEATRTDVRIENTPDEEQLANMKLLAEKVIEPTREYISNKRGVDTAITINSFFRSEEVNEKIGGSATSDHCKGKAIDIETNYKDFTNKDLFLAIKERGTFDQLIWEFGDEKNPDWVHVSYRKEGNRQIILRAIKQNRKTIYINFDL